jgi:uncharacterized membrane protein
MAETGSSSVPGKPEGRGLKIALVVSLAVNLLIIGALGGSLWAFRHGPPGPHRSFNAHLLAFAASLSPERRKAIWEATREERQAMWQERHGVREAREAARGALTANPFDKQKFEDAQMRVLDAEVKARREAHKLFVSVAAQLTPEERHAFAQWQPRREEQRLQWWRRHRPGEEAPAPK